LANQEFPYHPGNSFHTYMNNTVGAYHKSVINPIAFRIKKKRNIPRKEKTVPVRPTKKESPCELQPPALINVVKTSDALL